ncbi:MAG: hypothetical protein V2J10_07695 [Wenzhouxiangella sp.]|nr:hypothetical protein [Wenzhouxiangella sp.]
MQFETVTVIVQDTLPGNGLAQSRWYRTVGLDPEGDCYRLDLADVEVTGLLGRDFGIREGQIIGLAADQDDDIGEGVRPGGAFTGNWAGLIEVGITQRFPKRAGAAELINAIDG